MQRGHLERYEKYALYLVLLDGTNSAETALIYYIWHIYRIQA